MSVEFEEPKFNFDRKRYATETKNTPVIDLLTKVGLIKNKEDANKIMFVIIGIAVLATGFIVYINFIPSTVLQSGKENLNPEQLRELRHKAASHNTSL